MTPCDECGAELGANCEWEPDDWQRLDGRRELVSRGGWSGCETCIEFARRRVEVDTEEFQIGGWVNG